MKFKLGEGSMKKQVMSGLAKGVFVSIVVLICFDMLLFGFCRRMYMSFVHNLFDLFADKPKPREPQNGHWVTGCGCGCDDCVYKWFMRDDIDYQLSWHPGRCRCSSSDACPCICAHSDKRCAYTAIRVNQHVYELSQIISDVKIAMRKGFFPLAFGGEADVSADAISEIEAPIARRLASAFVNKSLLLSKAEELGIVMSNDEAQCEAQLPDSYMMAIFRTEKNDERGSPLEGTSIAPTKKELALIAAVLKHENLPHVDVYSDDVRLSYLDSLRKKARLVPTDFLSVVEQVVNKNLKRR